MKDRIHETPVLVDIETGEPKVFGNHPYLKPESGLRQTTAVFIEGVSEKKVWRLMEAVRDWAAKLEAAKSMGEDDTADLFAAEEELSRAYAALQETEKNG